MLPATEQSQLDAAMSQKLTFGASVARESTADSLGTVGAPPFWRRANVCFWR